MYVTIFVCISGHACVLVCVCVFVQLDQTQKELAKLQEQNSVLQEQLQDSRGRELNARDGYVLQVPPSSHEGCCIILNVDQLQLCVYCYQRLKG